MKKKHKESKAHISKFIDRKYFPDYEFTDDDFYKNLSVESTGKGDRPEPLAWAKKLEEITITQMWHEMADAWASGFGWWCIWRDNLSRAWEDRRGSNVMVRKILAQARLIKKRGTFMDAICSCSYFTNEDVNRYQSKWLQSTE